VRIFPIATVGLYKTFFLYLSLLPMLSLSAGFVHGVYFWNGQPGRGPSLVAQAWTVLSIISVVLFVLGLLANTGLTYMLGGTQLNAYCFIVSGALTLGSSFCEELWIAEQKVGQVAIFRCGNELLRAGIILTVAWYTRAIEYVFLAFAATSILRSCLAQVLGIYGGLRPMFSRMTLTTVFRYAAPVSAAGFFAALSGSLDQILLSRLLSSSDFAVFAMGCLALPPIFALEQSVNQVLAMKLAGTIVRGDAAAGAEAFRQAVVEIARLVIPAFLGLLTFAEPIVLILFTDHYLGSAAVLRLYACTYLLMMIPYDGGPKASGAGGWALRTFFVKTLVAVALVALLTKPFGIYGAMSGVLASGIYLQGAGLRFNYRFFGWSLAEQIPFRQLVPLALCALILSLASIVLRCLFTDSRMWFCICGGLFFVVYSVLFLLPERFKCLSFYGKRS